MLEKALVEIDPFLSIDFYLANIFISSKYFFYRTKLIEQFIFNIEPLNFTDSKITLKK
jgi:hypothetical protein